jgi:hypothetical protein
MEHSQRNSCPTILQGSSYAYASLVGRLIRNSSIVMIALGLGVAASTIAVDISQSFWQHSGVRVFLAAVEANLADAGPAPADPTSQPPVYVKDPVKTQRNENKARRKLTEEFKQRKASFGSTKVAGLKTKRTP